MIWWPGIGPISILFDPTAVRVGPLALAWHGIFTAVGMLAGLWLAAALTPRLGLPADAAWAAAWWVIPAAVVGARLLYAAEHAPLFVREPWRLVLVNEGGISVFGAVLGGILGATLAAWRQRIAPARLLDAIAPGFLLGQAIGRVGDIINGEHLGAHAPGLPWAVVYTHPATLGELGVPVHAAVAYEMLWDLAATGAVLWLLALHRQRAARSGSAFFAALLLYSAGRIWVGFFRLDQRVALGLGLAQLIGLAMLPAAAAGLIVSLRSRRTGRPDHPEQAIRPARAVEVET